MIPAQSYPVRMELFIQSSTAHDVYFIDRGMVKLTCVGPAGREFIIGLRGAGRTLGASSAILQRPYPVTAVTVTPCHLFRVPAATFLKLLETSAQFSWYVQQEQSRDVYDHLSTLTSLECLTTRQRLEQFLWNFISVTEINDPQQELRLQLPLKHWEIAELISVTPQHLSKLMRQIEQDGIIHREKGWLIVAKPDSLYHPTSF